MSKQTTITNKSAATNIDNALALTRLQRNEHLQLMQDLNFLIAKADKADILESENEKLKEEINLLKSKVKDN